MREIWAKRLAGLTGVIVVVLAVLFARSQDPSPPDGDVPQVSVDASAAAYVGSRVCAKCHADIHRAWSQSGHAFMLTAVKDGKAPVYPFSQVPQPPDGYQWQDIKYVVGGYHWKARFIDQRGYLITGAKAQYNLGNEGLGKAADWVAYYPDVTDRPYDCAHCHTTGYDADGAMENLPGTQGGWFEAGVGCESCHGPGGRHAAQPSVATVTDRSSQSCGRCHSREPMDKVQFRGGFIRHHQQFNSLQLGKHAGLSCNDCHDPHAGVIAPRRLGKPPMRRDCTSCHQMVAAAAKASPSHRGVDCVACHMPRAAKSAWGDAAQHAADVHSHWIRIDPGATSQGEPSEPGTSVPAITLEFACKHCHRPGGAAVQLDNERLRAAATGIHAPADATPGG